MKIGCNSGKKICTLQTALQSQMSKSGCIFKEKSAPLKPALLSHLVHFITNLMIKKQKNKKKEIKKIREVGVKNLHQLHPTVKGSVILEKYLKKLIDRLEVDVLRLQNQNDRLRRECNHLKRENVTLRNAVADIAGDKLTVCKLLGEGTRESEVCQ